MTESISEKLSFMRDIAQEFILKVLFPLLEKADLYTEFMRSASRLSIRWLRDVEQTTPAAPVKGTGPFYLMAQPPLLDQGGELRLPHDFPVSSGDLSEMISLFKEGKMLYPFIRLYG